MEIFLSNLVSIITFILNLFGVLFVLWGGLEAAFRITWEDMVREDDISIEKLNRKAFASKLVLGLEFFIAVDILSTFEHTTWEALGKLAALIVIRALISYVLNNEMKSLFSLEKLEKKQIKSPTKK